MKINYPNRTLKQHPFAQYFPFLKRVSLRRQVNYSWINKTKDKVWHRACKRSCKNFLKQQLQLELN